MPKPEEYVVGWICALSCESVAAQLFLDEHHEEGPDYVSKNDNNNYTLGKIGKHNVVIAVLPDGEYGISTSASVARDMVHSFPNIRVGLMVGIGGGVPTKANDIRLGDIVVSSPRNGNGGVFQYDFGRTVQEKSFQYTKFLDQPPTFLRTAVHALAAHHQINGHNIKSAIETILQKNPRLQRAFQRPDIGSDKLYQADVLHSENEASGSCDDATVLVYRRKRDPQEDDPAIHYGLIASANQLMKDAMIRDKLARERKVLCFEMEAAGLMNHFPCLVIRGISDYCDTHKNDGWQGYAAMTAAAYAKELLLLIHPSQVGANRNINNTSHLPPVEGPETPPAPTAVIPFSRDQDFVEPGTILDQIEQKCIIPGSRTALVGLGGVGKSQLAIEYAYRTRERSPNTWVFWVHASNAARFEKSYQDIADFLKIPGRKNSKANIFQLMYDWLRDNRRHWVLILDNVDDAGFFLESYNAGNTKERKALHSEDLQPLESYLPQCQNGAILMTTRSRSAALELVERRDIIPVTPMGEADGVALLEKKLEGVEKSDGLIKLATALEFMPLAIVQAASYIAHVAPRCSVRQYLEKFQESDRNKASLLDFEKGQLRRDRDAKNSIILTWQLSFDHIHHINPSAAELLSLMSFFDRQGIPESLIRNRNGQSNAQENRGNQDSDSCNHSDTDEDDDNDSTDGGSQDRDDKFEDDISTLRDYAFISVMGSGSSFGMHSLVQLATRKWLEAHDQQDRWKHQFIANLSSEFPTGNFENWAKCQALLPHAISAAIQKPKRQESLKMWATILYRAAWYAEQVGNGAQALEMSAAALKAREKLFGREHDETLWSLAMVGLANKLQGRWDAAESLFVQVMETRKSKLGVDHPNTLTSMANLASTFWNQGRWEEAESLEVQVMETSKSKLGVDHPDTLTSMANLASTYRNQGRWDEAESLEVQVMETRKSKLGVDHPDTLTSMANLASTFWNQGRWEEAESLEVQVMETSKSKLGVDHPNTLTSMANLASTYRNQGRWDEAESLFVQVMETSKSKLGVDHPGTLTSMANLAFTLKDKGEERKAIKLMEECVRGRKKILRLGHPDTKASEDILNSWRTVTTPTHYENRS